nr:uncharacterized protein LOC129381587 [Dermacentor andersoni]XP_054920570.1 uncharacterized protein LOC129381587 [Dermacentor andersoni]
MSCCAQCRPGGQLFLVTSWAADQKITRTSRNPKWQKDTYVVFGSNNAGTDGRAKFCFLADEVYVFSRALQLKVFFMCPRTFRQIRKKPRKGHKACCAAVWCGNSGTDSRAKFFHFPADDRCDIWRNYAKCPRGVGMRADVLRLLPLLGPDQKKGTTPTRPKQDLWSAVPTVGVEVRSLGR